MDDVRGEVLVTSRDTTQAAVITNKNKIDPLRTVNILMRKVSAP